MAIRLRKVHPRKKCLLSVIALCAFGGGAAMAAGERLQEYEIEVAVP